jgi:hypothetical protein
MVRRIVLLAGVVTVAALAMLTVRDTRPRQQTGPPAARQEPGHRPPPRTEAAPMPLGIVWPDATLARLDPRTLQPQRPQIVLGEYHSAWSFAPDGAQLALAISSPGEEGIPVVGERGRIGIRIIDVQRMTVVRDISTGVAAEALGWLAPRRLAALLQSGELVVLDPATGAILRHRQVSSGVLNPRWARGKDRLLVLIDSLPHPRLAVVDREGDLRVVALDRQRHGCCGSWSGRAGLAVDAAGERAVVVAAEVPAAEVDLKTMAVRYHHLASSAATLLPPPGTLGLQALQASKRQALWLASGALAVAGEQRADLVAETLTTRPAGVAVVDARSWRVRMVEPRADHVCAVGGRLLTYREEPLGPRTGRGIGLRVHDLQGRPLLHLLGDEAVWHVEVWGGEAYVYSPAAVRVVDPRSGRVVRTLPSRGGYVELLGGPRGP